MWPFLAALLVGFALMAVTLFFQIYRGIHKLRGRSVLEEPSEPKDVALE
jgi:TRAP-type C4-dicarboxylate transport system permease small subunit